MSHGKLCICDPDMRSRKSMLPVIQKNQKFIKAAAVLSARNLAFVRGILDRYDGRFFYDFDFSAFVFLDRQMQQAEEEQKKEAQERQMAKSIDVWNIFHEHMHINLWYAVYDCYDRQKTLLQTYPHWGVVLQDVIEGPGGPRPFRSAAATKLYITSEKFRRSVHRLNRGNQILPGSERLKMDFRRQMMIYEIVRTEFARLAHDDSAAPEYSRILMLEHMADKANKMAAAKPRIAAAAGRAGQEVLAAASPAEADNAGNVRSAPVTVPVTVPDGGAGRGKNGMVGAVSVAEAGHAEKGVSVSMWAEEDNRAGSAAAANGNLLEDIMGLPDDITPEIFNAIRFYENLVGLTRRTTEVNDTVIYAEQLEQIENSLEKLISKETILGKIYEDYEVRLKNGDAESYDDKKSLFTRTIDDYTKQHTEIEYDWLETLTYRINNYTWQGWQRFCDERKESSETVLHLTQLKHNLSQLKAATAHEQQNAAPHVQQDATAHTQLNAAAGEQQNATTYAQRNVAVDAQQNVDVFAASWASWENSDANLQNRLTLEDTEGNLGPFRQEQNNFGSDPQLTSQLHQLQDSYEDNSWLFKQLYNYLTIQRLNASIQTIRDAEANGNGVLDSQTINDKTMMERRALLDTVFNDYHNLVSRGVLSEFQEQKKYFLDQMETNDTSELVYLLNVSRTDSEVHLYSSDVLQMKHELLHYDRQQWNSFLQHTESAAAKMAERMSGLNSMRSFLSSVQELKKITGQNIDISQWSLEDQQVYSLAEECVSRILTSENLKASETPEEAGALLLADVRAMEIIMKATNPATDGLREPSGGIQALFNEIVLTFTECTKEFVSSMKAQSLRETKQMIRSINRTIYSDVAAKLWDYGASVQGGQWLRLVLSCNGILRQQNALAEVYETYRELQKTYAPAGSQQQRLFISLVRQYLESHEELYDARLFEEQQRFIRESDIGQWLRSQLTKNPRLLRENRMLSRILSYHSTETASGQVAASAIERIICDDNTFYKSFLVDIFNDSQLYLLEHMEPQQWELFTENLSEFYVSVRQPSEQLDQLTETSETDQQIVLLIQNMLDSQMHISEAVQYLEQSVFEDKYPDMVSQKKYFINLLDEGSINPAANYYSNGFAFADYVYAVLNRTSISRGEKLPDAPGNVTTMAEALQYRIEQMNAAQWTQFITDFIETYDHIDTHSTELNLETIQLAIRRKQWLERELSVLEMKVNELQPNMAGDFKEKFYEGVHQSLAEFDNPLTSDQYPRLIEPIREHERAVEKLREIQRYVDAQMRLTVAVHDFLGLINEQEHGDEVFEKTSLVRYLLHYQLISSDEAAEILRLVGDNWERYSEALTAQYGRTDPKIWRTLGQEVQTLATTWYQTEDKLLELTYETLAKESNLYASLISRNFSTALLGENDFSTALLGKNNFSTTFFGENNFSTALLGENNFLTALFGENGTAIPSEIQDFRQAIRWEYDRAQILLAFRQAREQHQFQSLAEEKELLIKVLQRLEYLHGTQSENVTLRQQLEVANETQWEQLSTELIKNMVTEDETISQHMVDHVLNLHRDMEYVYAIVRLLERYDEIVRLYNIEDIQTQKMYFTKLYNQYAKVLDRESLKVLRPGDNGAAPPIYEIFSRIPRWQEFIEQFHKSESRNFDEYIQSMTTQTWEQFTELTHQVHEQKLTEQLRNMQLYTQAMIQSQDRITHVFKFLNTEEQQHRGQKIFKTDKQRYETSPDDKIAEHSQSVDPDFWKQATAPVQLVLQKFVAAHGGSHVDDNNILGLSNGIPKGADSIYEIASDGLRDSRSIFEFADDNLWADSSIFEFASDGHRGDNNIFQFVGGGQGIGANTFELPDAFGGFRPSAYSRRQTKWRKTEWRQTEWQQTEWRQAERLQAEWWQTNIHTLLSENAVSPSSYYPDSIRQLAAALAYVAGAQSDGTQQLHASQMHVEPAYPQPIHADLMHTNLTHAETTHAQQPHIPQPHAPQSYPKGSAMKLAPSLYAAAQQLKSQDTQLGTLKQSLDTHASSMEALENEQKRMKAQLEQQEAHLKQQREEENQLYGRMLWRLQKDLRLERLRRGME